MEKTDISQSVKTLDFGSQYGVRVQRIFRENGISSIRDLCRQIRLDLAETRYLGEKSVAMIEVVLEKHGLRLNMTDKELDEYAGIDYRRQETLSDPSVPEDADEAKWEQRRYEIAKELCVNQHMEAYIAVKEADKIIRTLKGAPNYY